MIEHIKTKVFKALPVSKFSHLGHVNVFCGKNNSGKTTVLNAIEKPDQCLLGIEMSDNVFMEIAKSFTGVSHKPKWTGSVPHPDQYRAAFEIGLKGTAKHFPILFDDDLEAFLEQLQTDFEIAAQKEYYQLKDRSIREAWTQLFSFQSPERMLIPPKRSLQFRERNTTLQAVKSDGSWLLNELFLWKNQPEESDDYKLFHRIKDIFEDVSAGFTFDLVQEFATNERPSPYEVALKFRGIDRRNWINAEDCGLGLRELLVLIYFALEPRFETILIEEPENHIHPEMQRRLLRFLREETDKQYFISTHSNIFLNTTYVDRIFHVSFVDGEIKVSDATKRTELLNELGYSVSDNLVSDLIILVEGPKDTPIIEEYLKKFGIDADYNIKTWALGGDIMDQVDLSIFAERYKVLALVDKDPKSVKVRNRFVKKCIDLQIPVTRLSRYAIENYFTVRALKEVFGTQISDRITSIAEDKTLEKQIGLNVKNNNRKIAQEMTIEEIAGTDLERFFKKVKKVCENQ